MTFVYDPTDPAFAAQSHDIYRRLRDDFPVWRDPGNRFYALSRFDDVLGAARDWETFSSTGKLEAQYIKPTMNSYDPPRHTQLRALISRGFTPRRVADIEPQVRSIARRLLDEFSTSSSAELIAQFAGPLPAMVMGRLIGLPDAVVVECRELTDEFMHHTKPSDAFKPANRAYEIFAELYDQRRRHPEDDLLTALVQAEIDGERLNEDDLLSFAWLLLVGGNDTTTNLIANGLELFARHPDQRQRLVADPSLLGPATDEVLRYASPTHTLPRTALLDVELHGTTVPAGSRVLLLWSAANLDEREFPDPERFDIDRRPTRHLAFGHGVHYCLGASLAKLEARVAWEELLRRVPDYAITVEPHHFVSSTFYGWEALHVQLAPPAAG
ncbi:MAG TPA: cytochrome P450 [Acidimicrobiales bacterium]|nr:cytochrome P450 [Acidimicrobiales bacterium]